MSIRYRLFLLKRWLWRARVRIRHQLRGATACTNCLKPVVGRLTDLNIWRGSVVCPECHHVLFVRSLRRIDVVITVDISEYRRAMDKLWRSLFGGDEGEEWKQGKKL